MFLAGLGEATARAQHSSGRQALLKETVNRRGGKMSTTQRRFLQLALITGIFSKAFFFLPNSCKAQIIFYADLVSLAVYTLGIYSRAMFIGSKFIYIHIVAFQTFSGG